MVFAASAILRYGIVTRKINCVYMYIHGCMAGGDFVVQDQCRGYHLMTGVPIVLDYLILVRVSLLCDLEVHVVCTTCSKLTPYCMLCHVTSEEPTCQ